VDRKVVIDILILDLTEDQILEEFQINLDAVVLGVVDLMQLKISVVVSGYSLLVMDAAKLALILVVLDAVLLVDVAVNSALVLHAAALAMVAVAEIEMRRLIIEVMKTEEETEDMNRTIENSLCD